MRQVDITGLRFGMLVVNKKVSGSIFTGKYWTNTKWECICDCGEVCIKLKCVLTRGTTKSCGCLRVEYGKKKFGGIGELSKSHWGSILRHARDRNIKVDITIKDAWDIFIEQERKCSLSGITIRFGRSKREEETGVTTASLDRIDSTKNYTRDNVQWVHKLINKSKFDLKQDDFIEMCRLISTNTKHYSIKSSLAKESEEIE
jgi:hypothetical protein